MVVYVDAGVEQLDDVLPALGVAARSCARARHEDERRMTGERGVRQPRAVPR
jgi:hypothetical protein